jgi:hypothetical protein
MVLVYVISALEWVQNLNLGRSGRGMANYISAGSCTIRLVLAILLIFISISSPLSAEDFCLPEKDGVDLGKDQPSDVDKTLQDGGAFIFFDANPNIRGFVSKEATEDQEIVSYKDIVHIVPHILTDISNNVKYQKITKTISPISSTEIMQVSTPEFYQCQGGVPLSECNQTKTNIDEFMALVAGLPASSLFVLASDLSINGNLLLDNKPGSIRNSLETIMQSGRAVGIFGFKVPFSGAIFGLPSGRRYMDAHSRPAFLLAVGARDKVLRFHQLLQKDFGSRWSEEDHNFLLFTNRSIRTPLIGDAWSKDTFQAGKGAYADILWDQKSNFQQFTLSQKNEGILAKINLTKIQTPFSLPIKSFQVSEDLWQWRKKGDVCKKSWLKLDPSNPEKMIQASRNGEYYEFKLGGSNSGISHLPKRRMYFIRTEVTATDISFDEKLAPWVLGWNFDERSEDTLFNDQVTFFPTLNLRRFVGQLESVTRSTFKPEVIARFDLGVSLER